MRRAKNFLYGVLVLPLLGSSSGASAQSLTISGPTMAYVGDQIVLDIVGDPTGGTADRLAYARVRWDPALAEAVSMVPTPDTTTFVTGGGGIGQGEANGINLVNAPISSSALPNEIFGGELTLELIAPGTLELTFDAPFPLPAPRFFGLPAGQAGTWQVVVLPEPTRALLLSAGLLGLLGMGRRRIVW